MLDPYSIIMTTETSLSVQTIETVLPEVPATRGRSVARWVSRLASPPLLAVICAALTAARSATYGAWGWAGFLVGFTILLPTLFIVWLLRHGKITDFDVYVRKQRFWPYVVSLSCGALTWIVMSVGGAPQMFLVLSGAAVGQGLTLFLINTRWKISAHAAGTASFAVLSWQLLGSGGLPLLLIIPLVAWSRLRLHRHTFGQVVAGSALGAGFIFGALSLWG